MSPRLRQLFESLPRRCNWVLTANASARYPEGTRQISERRLLQYLKRVLKKLGLQGHLHTFRHAFISEAIIQGVPEAVLRQWVGHVDADTLRHYTHIHSPDSQRAMQQLTDRRAKESVPTKSRDEPQSVEATEV